MRIACMLALVLVLSGCGLTRDIEVRQGNTAMVPADADQALGLGTTEVRALLGPPQSRWQLDGLVWLYYIKPAASSARAPFLIELRFAPNGLVNEVNVREGVPPTDG